MAQAKFQPGPGLLQPRRNFSKLFRRTHRTKLPHAPLVACARRPSGLQSGRDATSHPATPRRAVAFPSGRDDGCKTHQSPGPSDVVVEQPKPLWLHLASKAFRYLGLLVIVASLIVPVALAKGGHGHGSGGRSGGHVGGRSFGGSSGGSGSGRSGGSSSSSSRGGGHIGGGSSPSSGTSYGGGASSSWSGGGGRWLSASGSAVSASSSAAAATRATTITPSSTRPGGASATTPSTSTPLTTTKSTGGVIGGGLFASSSSSSSSSNHSNDLSSSSSTGSAAGRGGGMSAGPGASAYAASRGAPLLYGSGDSNGLSRQGAPGRRPARVFGTSSNNSSSSSSSSNNNNNNNSSVIANTTNIDVYGGVGDSGSRYPSGIAKTAFDSTDTDTDTINTWVVAKAAVVTAVGQTIATPAAATVDPSTAQAAADSVPDAVLPLVAYPILFLLFYLLVFKVPEMLIAAVNYATAPRFRIQRVQVALLSSVRRELQDSLVSLSKGVYTGGAEGLHKLLQGSLVALLRRRSYFAYGSVYETKRLVVVDMERKFSRMSLEEQSRFSEITRRNVDGHKMTSNRSGTGPGGDASWSPSAASPPFPDGEGERQEEDELVVVTLLVAVDAAAWAAASGGDDDGADVALLKGLGGGHDGGGGRSSRSAVEGALKRLSELRAGEIKAVELLWTPEARGDTFSSLQLLAEYPHLLPL